MTKAVQISPSPSKSLAFRLIWPKLKFIQLRERFKNKKSNTNLVTKDSKVHLQNKNFDHYISHYWVNLSF